MSGLPPSHGHSQPPLRSGFLVWIVFLIIFGIVVVGCGLLASAIKVRTKQVDRQIDTDRLLHETTRVGLGVMMYAVDYRDKLPSGPSPSMLASQLKPYVSGMIDLDLKIGAYRLNYKLDGKDVRTLANASEVWVCEQGPDAQHYVYISFADGHAKRYESGQEKAVLAVEPRFK